MRFAIRSLSKSPVLAAIAVASLGFGMGANLTIYSAVRELILNDVSARALDRLVRVSPDLTLAQYRDIRPAAPFADLAFETGIHDANWQAGDHAEVAWEMDTSPNFFDVLGIRPHLGRLYEQADDGRPIAVISNGFWTRRLGRDPHVIGRAVQLDGRVLTVLGVLPADYRSVLGHGASPEVYAPVRLDSQQRCHPIGRLRDGVTRAQAEAAWISTAERIPGRGSEPNRQSAVLRPLGGLAANAAGEGDPRRFYLFFVTLFGVAEALTLIACGNVAGLLLARGVNRQREIAVRKALGAGRWQVARPIAAESMVLVGGGCVVALVVDAFLRDRLSQVRWPNAYNVPFEFHFHGDSGLLAYALLTAFAALLISALVPALSGSDVDLAIALKRSEPAFGFGLRGIRPISFAGIQVVLSVLLLTLGAVFTRGFLQIAAAGPGFDSAHTLIAAVHPFPRHRELEWQWRERLVSRAGRVPGVLSMTSTDLLPLMGEVPSVLVRRKEDSAVLDVYGVAVGERYFQTLGIHILRGRDFEIADRDRKPTPAIVSRTLGRQLFGNADPIGAQLVEGRGRDQEVVLEVIGIAADTSMRTLGEGSMPALYTPDYNGQFLVKVAGDASQWIAPLRDALKQVDSTSALDIRPLNDAIEGAMFPMKVASGFVGSLSMLGLALTLVGLYGSLSFAVSRRRREMGICAALGATRFRILLTSLRDGMVVVAAGIAVGLALAAIAIRPLKDLLPAGLDPWDPRMFAAVVALVLFTGAAAALAPARRAASVDPAVALREE